MIMKKLFAGLIGLLFATATAMGQGLVRNPVTTNTIPQGTGALTNNGSGVFGWSSSVFDGNLTNAFVYTGLWWPATLGDTNTGFYLNTTNDFRLRISAQDIFAASGSFIDFKVPVSQNGDFFARLLADQTFSGSNAFTGPLTMTSNVVSSGTGSYSGSNQFTGALTLSNRVERPLVNSQNIDFTKPGNSFTTNASYTASLLSARFANMDFYKLVITNTSASSITNSLPFSYNSRALSNASVSTLIVPGSTVMELHLRSDSASNLFGLEFGANNPFLSDIVNAAPGSSQGQVVANIGGGRFGLTNLSSSGSGYTNSTLYVRTNGNDSTAVRGRIDLAYLTISNAILASLFGDVIDVGPGTNNVSGIGIPRGVTVRGAGKRASWLIQPGGASTSVHGIVLSNNCVLENISVTTTNIATGDSSNPVYFQSGESNIWVRNCYIFGWIDALYSDSTIGGGPNYITGNHLDGSWDTCTLAGTNYCWGNIVTISNQGTASSGENGGVRAFMPQTGGYMWVDGNVINLINTFANVQIHAISVSQTESTVEVGNNLITGTNTASSFSDIHVQGGVANIYGNYAENKVTKSASGPATKTINWFNQVKRFTSINVTNEATGRSIVSTNGSTVWSNSAAAIVTITNGSIGVGTAASTTPGSITATNLSSTTVTNLVGADTNGLLKPITIGSGLSLAVNGTLSATASGSTFAGNQTQFDTTSTNLKSGALFTNTLFYSGTALTLDIENRVLKNSGGVTTYNWESGAFGQNVLFDVDNTLDIGASAASRPRDLFLARKATIAGGINVTGGGTTNNSTGFYGNGGGLTNISASATNLSPLFGTNIGTTVFFTAINDAQASTVTDTISWGFEGPGGSGVTSAISLSGKSDNAGYTNVTTTILNASISTNVANFNFNSGWYGTTLTTRKTSDARRANLMLTLVHNGSATGVPRAQVKIEQNGSGGALTNTFKFEPIAFVGTGAITNTYNLGKLNPSAVVIVTDTSTGTGASVTIEGSVLGAE